MNADGLSSLTNFGPFFFKKLKKKTYKFFSNYYQDNWYLPDLINNLIEFGVNNFEKSVERTIEIIAQNLPDENDQIVRLICESVEDKLKPGHYWRALKHLRNKGSVPSKFLDICLSERIENNCPMDCEEVCEVLRSGSHADKCTQHKNHVTKLQKGITESDDLHQNPLAITSHRYVS